MQYKWNYIKIYKKHFATPGMQYKLLHLNKENNYFTSGWDAFHYKNHFATNIEMQPLLK